MYVFELRYSNASRNESGGLQLGVGQDVLKKWTFVDFTGTEKDLELLQLTALAGSGCTEYLEHLPYNLPGLIGDGAQPLQLELVWVEHIARKGVIFEKPRRRSGLKITPQGKGTPLYSRDKRGFLRTSITAGFAVAAICLLRYFKPCKAHCSSVFMPTLRNGWKEMLIFRSNGPGYPRCKGS